MISTHDLMLAYSEWLDRQGVILSESDSGDHRSHDELVTAFISERDL